MTHREGTKTLIKHMITEKNKQLNNTHMCADKHTEASSNFKRLRGHSLSESDRKAAKQQGGNCLVLVVLWQDKF